MTIAEQIALQAGVCRQSVSAVLNGSKNKVKKEKRELILELAKKMNYLPNPNAKSMSGRSVKTIGIILQSYPSIISYAQMNAINNEVLKRGYKCYIISPQTPEMEHDAILEFGARKIDGMIVCAIHSMVNYDKCPIPAVVVGAKKEAFEVSVDYAYGMNLALKHLHQVHGHNRIVFLCNTVNGNDAKFKSYCQFIKENNLPEFSPLEINNQQNLEQQVKALIKKKQVTAFVGTGDMITGQFCNLLYHMGIRIPEDVAVTGYDGTLLSHSGSLQLSAVVHPVTEVAKSAADMLFDKIASKNMSKREPVLIRPTFFKGQTCGCSGINQDCSISDLQMDFLRTQDRYTRFFES